VSGCSASQAFAWSTPPYESCGIPGTRSRAMIRRAIRFALDAYSSLNPRGLVYGIEDHLRLVDR
jgi:hypothetical protein